MKNTLNVALGERRGTMRLRVIQWTATLAVLATAVGFALLTLRLRDDFPRQWRQLKPGADFDQVYAALGGPDRRYRVNLPLLGSLQAWTYPRTEEGAQVEYIVFFNAERKAGVFWRVPAGTIASWADRPPDAENDDMPEWP